MGEVGGSAAAWGRSVARAVVVALAAACLLAGGAEAQSTTERFELSRPVEAGLVRLQEQWLRWLGAINQSDHEAATAAVDDLLATAGQLGMQRLPDLAIGAAVRAAQAARTGDPTRGAWAIEAAERLDPGRPETAFAAGTVQFADGAYFAAVGQHLRGWTRVWRHAPWSNLCRIGAAYWLLATVLAAAGLFVGLALAAHRQRIAADGARLLGALPAPLAVGVGAVLLLWPLALPGRWLWLLVWWSVVVWIYEGLGGRVAIVFGWLAIAGAPFLAHAAERAVALELSPAMRATRQLATGRLSGGLFADLEVLGTTLTGKPQTIHVYADLHRRLGQWEPARLFYQELLEVEPSNVPALLAMGAYHFRRGDYGNAVQAYQRAVTSDDRNPAGFYNLSLAYSQNNYQFEESSRALQQAQAIDKELVSRWIQEASEERVVVPDGAFARSEEIAALLEAAQHEGNAKVASSRRWVGLAIPLGGALLAMALATARRRAPGGDPDRGPSADLPRLLEDYVPGVAALLRGAGLPAFLVFLWLAGAVLLPLVAGRAFRLTLGYEPGPALPVTLAVVGLGAAVGLRILLARRAEG